MNQSVADYSPFFYYSPFPSIIYDRDTFEIIEVNNPFVDLIGFTVEELSSLSLQDIYLEDDFSRLHSINHAIGKLEERSFVEVFTHQSKSGDLKSMEVTGYASNFLNRNCIMATLKDVSKNHNEKSDINLLLDSSLDVFCTINENGCFEYVSASAFNLWGYYPEELIGKPYQHFILEEDLQNTIETEASVLSGKNLTSFINRYKKKDGGVALNSWSVTWNENTKQLFCVARDAREIISKEEEILASEQRFKALVQEGSDLIGILDLEGNYLYVSPTSTSVLGISPEEFMGRNAFEFIHQDDASRILESIQKTAIENKVVLEPFRFQNHKKEWRWIETVFTNMLDHPAVKGIVANSRDITERIEERHKLKLLESVIINTKDSILITEAEPLDAPGPRIIYVNEAFTKMTGYTAAEVIGKSPRILQGPNSSKEELQKLSHALRNWEPYEITTINYKKNGEEFWINFTVTPVANAEGWYTHWIAIERDVSEQKIKELEKELLAEISFDFNAENDFQSSLKKVCKSISGFGKFDWVELWTSNLEKNQMNLSSHYLASAGDEIFYTCSSEIKTIKKHEGLAGKVWSEGIQLLWQDLDQNSDFLRRDAAKKIGLKAVLGIPLTYQDEVVGVLKVGTKQDSNYLDKFTKLLNRLEGHLGSELNRKKLEKDLSQLFNAIPDIICLLDYNGRFLKINKVGCKLMGYSEEHILTHSYDEFAHQVDKGMFIKEVSQGERDDTFFKFENRFVTKTGETIWLSWYCSKSLNENIVYATAKNITEEMKLRELNSQTRNLAKIGSWELDFSSQKVYWSDEIYQILETSPTSFVTSLESANDLYREDFQQMVGEKIENCIEKGEPFDFEAVLITSKKNERWIRAIGNAEFVDGASKRIFGCIQDITSQKNTENTLTLFSENLPGIIFQYVLYPDGTDCIKNISGAVEQLWGFTAQEAMEDSNVIWEQVKLGGKMEEVQASIFNSIQTKSKWTCRIHYVMPSGELRTNLGIGTPSFLADGSVLFHSIVLDITQEVKNEKMLEETAKMARIGSWEMDLLNQDGNSMYWSPMIFEILELEDDYNPTLTGGIEFHLGESKERIQKALELLITEGIEFDEEILLRTAKGNERWSRAIGKCEIVNNKRTRIYGSYQDIHELKLTEQNLKNAYEEKNNILESIGDAFFAVDDNWIITYWNKQAELVLGKSKEQVLGKHLWEEYEDAIDTDFYRQYHKVKETNELASFEEYYPALKIWIDVSAYPSQKGLAIYFKDVTKRKEADQERKRLLTTLENSLNEIYIFDSETFLFTYINKAALNNLGYCQSEIKTLSLFDIKREFSELYFKELVTPLVNHDKDRIIFFTNHYRKDGSYYPSEIHLTLVEEGSTLRFSAVALDITKRKIATEKLQKSYDEKNKILESIGDAFCAVDNNWIVTYWNKEAELILGRKKDEILGKHLWEEYPDVVNTEFYRQYFKSIETRDATYFESYYPAVSKWLEVSAYPSEEGLSVYFKDITQRKESDIELLNANERFEKVTEATNDAIWDWDLENQIYHPSKAIERFFGKSVSKSFAEADLWKDAFHPQDLPKIKESIYAAISDPLCNRWELEYRLIDEYGKTLYIIDRGVIIRDSEGNATRMIGAMTDISEHKQMTIELRELNEVLQRNAMELKRSNEELEQFAFIASHDLQEPLRMITSFMDVLKRKYGSQLDEKANQYIHFARDGAERMKQIILDLMEYSRTNRPTEGIEEVNLNNLISDFTQLRRKLILERSATIRVDNLPVMKIYKAAITQIFHCLLDNALKYSRTGIPPLIEIKAKENEKTWEFSVRDNGIGIDSKYFDKVFVIFQRLHTKDEFTGTGLGLSIAKRLVEFLDGKIWLESELGVGTVFYFTISKYD